ncbi:DUF58 domain-containing protein [Novosphingobium sediminicola]|uniref:Uncharacterized protein (DUF58 family) n=1 Tax=Novosphingobium sediminicola TaxID=563162 RepID=A0A7W6CCZ5_9SPHN|nr:uncharacterized protein (DUF58 family) [Novosphingobium sediminicola]
MIRRLAPGLRMMAALMRPGVAPAPRCVWALVALGPVAVVLAGFVPALWIAAPLLGLLLLALVLVDGALAGRLEEADVIAPAQAEIGQSAVITIRARLSRPARMEAALALDPRLAPGGKLSATLTGEEAQAPFTPSRRCHGAINTLWLRWRGPLGLAMRIERHEVDASVRVLPSVAALRGPAMQTYLRDASLGLIARRLRGEGQMFETLTEYQPGMDRRRIDWKVSARHAHLYAKEYEVERNNPIVLAMDCGAAMCEPVAGLPRLDRAVSAALQMAWVALKAGDRVSLFGFAARVIVSTPFVADTRDFHALRSAAADLDYTAREANFTLALSTLAQQLARRSLIVVFSEFADPTSAELMIESIGRLIARHRVLFVCLRDEELETLAGGEVVDMEALGGSVAASALLRQREWVLMRLRAMGVDVVEAAHDAVGARLIDAYMAIRSRGGIG